MAPCSLSFGCRHEPCLNPPSLRQEGVQPGGCCQEPRYLLYLGLQDVWRCRAFLGFSLPPDDAWHSSSSRLLLRCLTRPVQWSRWSQAPMPSPKSTVFSLVHLVTCTRSWPLRRS